MEPFSKADTSPYVATAEAADYLKISKRTLERLRLTGGGPKYAKAGRRVLYRKSWLDQWLEGRCFTSTSEARSRGVR
jgi:excisionase family DNA binding protein